jgi:hypothetical protein
MNNSNISKIISEYLRTYANSSFRKRPEPSSETVRTIRKYPKTTFRIIDTGAFQKPENLDPRDLDSPLFRLLVTFADLIPELLIPKMTNGFWGARYAYIQCAAASKSLDFVPTLIDLLTDRSIYVKTLMLRLIIECPHLQIPDAMPKLDKLSKMKSFQEPSIDRELLDKARQCVAAKM